MSRPIAHEFAPMLPGYPELVSVTLSRDLERWNTNAEIRDKSAVKDIWTLALVFIAASSISFLALYLAH